MPTDATAAAASSTPHRAGSGGWCAWHQSYAPSARLVRLSDAGSGNAARGLFACASCRHAYDLIPLADQP